VTSEASRCDERSESLRRAKLVIVTSEASRCDERSESLRRARALCKCTAWTEQGSDSIPKWRYPARTLIGCFRSALSGFICYDDFAIPLDGCLVCSQL
jgi:hypothetical protein